jgi:peptidoglycan/xylan/chitin deacetylase (PgdA/CDA1 family)
MIKRIVKLIISLAFWAIDYIKNSLLSFLGRKNPGTCIVLYYHLVKDTERSRFAHQMDMLLRLAMPISLEGQPKIQSGIHYVAVTFDDAFRDSLYNALPEMEKKNIPVTVFVPTGCLGLSAPWLSVDEYEVHGGIVMVKEELREMAKNPLVSLGSHCITHKALPSLNDAEAKEEIFRSKADLEKILGNEVMSLSFPHGAFETKILEWAQDAGYSHVYSVEPLPAFLHPDEYVTGRFRVDPTDWGMEFRLKVLGSYRWLSLIKNRRANV